MNLDRLLRRAYVALPVAVGTLSSQAAAVRAAQIAAQGARIAGHGAQIAGHGAQIAAQGAAGQPAHFAAWQYAVAGALGLIASLPAGSGPLGLLTPPAEGVPSLAQSVGASARSLLGAPGRARAARKARGAARKAADEERRWRQVQEAIRKDAVHVAGELIKTGEFVMTPLGLAPAHPQSAGAPASAQDGPNGPPPGGLNGPFVTGADAQSAFAQPQG